jgi:hypothetical protein
MKNLLSLSKKWRLFFSLLASSLFFISCSDDDNSPSNNDIPSALEFLSLQNNALENLTQTFEFDASDGAVSFTSSKGVTVYLNTNCIEYQGVAISGTFEVEFIEIFDGGNMITTNKPTMGLMGNGDKSLLISGGEFFINATQGGVQLELTCPMTVIVPTSLTNPGGDQEMTLWNGVFDDNGNLTWEEIPEDPAGNGNIFVEGQGSSATYYAVFNNFGWTNVDKFYSDAGPKTTILVDVPNGYDNTNSAVYLHYDGEGNALANLDTYDENTGLFSEHYGQIPIGLACHIIFATESDGQWRYAIKGVTITANTTYSFTLSETTVGTEQQLIDAINNLP